MREVLGYSAVLLNGTDSISSQAVNYVVGCEDPDDVTCEKRNSANPVLHITVETWAYGISRADALPHSATPALLSVLNYQTTDQWYVWQEVVDTAASSSEHLLLDFYKSYNSSIFKPHKYFDHWTKIFELVPSEFIAKCSELGPGSYEDRLAAKYQQLTNDSDVTCHHNDSVWFSLSCRANTSECVPLLLQYNYASAMQLSFFLNFPLAIVKVKDGATEFNAVYYNAIRKGRFLFDWFQPDDSLADAQGRLPVLVVLPPINQLQQSQQIYRTGNAFVNPRNYAWPSLASVDRRVAQLSASIALYDEDMDQLMLASRLLKDAGYSATSVEFRVACDWVLAQESRWRPWIPVRCAPGDAADATLTECAPCAPGTYCPGGLVDAVPCPPGHYCLANASAPRACPPGRDTRVGGAPGVGDCSVCTGGYIPLGPGGGCVATAPALSIIVILVAVAAAAAAAGAQVLRAAHAQAQWTIKAAEVVLYEDDVLGCGSQGAVARGLYRGTPVAIKYFTPPQWPARGSGYGPGPDADLPGPAETQAGGSSRSLLPAEFDRSFAVRRRAKVAPRLLKGTAVRADDAVLAAAMLAMARVRHPSVAMVMGVAELVAGGARRACVVMELYELGSLRDLLRNRSYFLQGEAVLGYLRGIAQGMRFLHAGRPPLVHGALKTSNVLIDARQVLSESLPSPSRA